MVQVIANSKSRGKIVLFFEKTNNLLDMINDLQSSKERFSTCILKMVYLKLHPQSNPTVEEVLHLNDLLRMFANTENPLWGMASDESVSTRMEVMYAYSPKLL